MNAEGCFKTVEDYVSAAYIYQHGEVPDHIFQAFIWALKAISLNQKTILS